MKDKKFIIGIGSQRAGSTLLYRILDKYSDVFMHPVKELHYFDTLYNVREKTVLTDFAKRNLQRINKDIYQGAVCGNYTKRFRCELRTYDFLYNKSIKDIEYVDLFRPCLVESDSFGEITPEYMLLSDDQIRSMRETLGKDAVIVLITRDPIDRFASSVKLLNMYGSDNNSKLDINQAVDDAIANMPTWIEQQVKLNDYATALQSYRRYFDNVVCLSYEVMIDNPSFELAKLKQFIPSLDVDRAIEALNERVNTLGESSDLSAESRQSIVNLHMKFNISHEVAAYE